MINGYTIVFKKMVNSKETVKSIPMIIENDEVEDIRIKNEFIDRGIRYLEADGGKVKPSKYHN